MHPADAKRFVRTNARWLQPAQLSIVNRNILYLTLDTAVQGLMMGGIFSFLSVFLVRLGATTLQTSLLTSLPAIVMVIASPPAGLSSRSSATSSGSPTSSASFTAGRFCW